MESDSKIISFQMRRLIVGLFKNYLNQVEDIKEDHLSMLDKIEELLLEEDKNKLDLVDYLTESRYNLIRKRILDLGNDAAREVEQILEQYEIKAKK